MHGIDHYICENQGKLFLYAYKEGYDIEKFSEAYMNSDFCMRQFDAIYSWFQTADVEDIMDYLTKEIKVNRKESNYNENMIFWIGFIYRYIAFSTKLSSKEIVKNLPFEKMVRYYPGMHTQDEEFFLSVLRDEGRI